jgi:hypothetical protein
VRKPTILISMGSGHEDWISIDLDTLRFLLEVKDGKHTEEVLSLSDLKTRFPNIASLVAEILAAAVRTVRTQTTGPIA